MKKIFTSLTVILALYSGNLFSRFGGTLEERPGSVEILSHTEGEDVISTDLNFLSA